MAPPLLFSPLLLVAFVLVCLMLHVWWPNAPRAIPQTPCKLATPRHKRSPDSNPFPGFIHQPLCEPCAQGAIACSTAPGFPPALIRCPCGRRRTVNTHAPFSPDPGGNSRAHGHPGGQPGRQLQSVSCAGDVSETPSTIFPGQHASPGLSVRVIACLAAGLSIRGTARVCAIDPNTVRSWSVETAAQRNAFAAYFLHELHVNQVQLDELYAVLSVGRAGKIREAEASDRLSHAPHWQGFF